jgi:hypothetical protein
MQATKEKTKESWHIACQLASLACLAVANPMTASGGRALLCGVLMLAVVAVQVVVWVRCST